MTGPDLRTALQNMHQLFLGADPALLFEIDKRVCHGKLAHWALFLRHTLFLTEQITAAGGQAPVLDRRFAKAVIAQMPATHRRP